MDQLRKRVIFLPRNEPPMIVGTFDESVHNVRDFVEFDYKGQKVEASLLKVTPRAIYYRQTMPAPVTGRLGEFHPAQR